MAGIPAVNYQRRMNRELGEDGNPDIMGTWQGISFVIEMKRDANTNPDPIQLYELQKWSDAGAIAMVGWDPRKTMDELSRRIVLYRGGEFTPFSYP